MNLKLFHNVSKLFLSIECNYKYAYKGALKSHKSIHIKEKLLDEKKITKGSKVYANMNFLCNKCDYVCDDKRTFMFKPITYQSFYLNKMLI